MSTSENDERETVTCTIQCITMKKSKDFSLIKVLDVAENYIILIEYLQVDVKRCYFLP